MGSTPTKEVGAERAQLVLVVGGDVGRSFVVERGGLTLGRASSANARIVAEDISREHARVYPGDDGRYVIEDLESRNGTRVNGVPFSGKRPLELGDRVQLGASVLLIFTRYDAVEAQIERLTRLDSVLQLAGGLAHGFGNVMAVIGGNLAFALSLLDESDEGAPLDRAELREALEDVQTASDQGAKLTRSLSQLTRRQIQRAAQVDMREMASATLELMRPSLGADVELTCDVDDDCRVVGDEQALAQMLTHLCVNAGEAMPRGGHLVVQGRIIDLTRDTRALAPLLARGRYVALSVRDTGIGMDAATRRRALEPFFTTKQGTGLGLALAFSIAREHGGALEIDSAPDKGCRIDVLLPLGSEDMTHGPTADGWRAAPVAATSASTSASTELGTIFDDDSEPGDEPTASYGLGIDEMIAGLAADDERVARDPAMRALLDEPRVVIALRERAMRRAVARMLALAGYGTQPVAPEALMMTIAEQVPDAVLLQVSSREVESIERFERLVSAAIPVVIVTSPEDEALATRLHARGARAWLREPFVVEDVLACAARALGEQAVPRTED